MATNFSPSSGSYVLNKFPSISQWSDTGPSWPSCCFSHGVFERLVSQGVKRCHCVGMGQDRREGFYERFQGINFYQYRLSTIRDDSQHSVLSDEDIDYWDKTEEDLDTPCGRPRRSKRLQKRPSAPPLEELDETPPKRYKTEVFMLGQCVWYFVLAVSEENKKIDIALALPFAVCINLDIYISVMTRCNCFKPRLAIKGCNMER